jgi:Uma2 family endonuclease
MAHREPTYHTADMVRALLDEQRAWPRYETIHGELLVTPAPRPSHQYIVGRLHAQLWRYLEHENTGALFGAPADLSWGRDDVLVQPDLFVVPLDEARAAHATGAWSAIRRLLLAVEVLSPSSARTDRFTKRTLYQRMGVPLYWVLDGEREECEVWTPDRHFPEIERERLTWHPAGASAPLAIELAPLFAAP